MRTESATLNHLAFKWEMQSEMKIKESWSRSMILDHIQWLRKKWRWSQPPKTIQDT